MNMQKSHLLNFSFTLYYFLLHTHVYTSFVSFVIFYLVFGLTTTLLIHENMQITTQPLNEYPKWHIKSFVLFQHYDKELNFMINILHVFTNTIKNISTWILCFSLSEATKPTLHSSVSIYVNDMQMSVQNMKQYLNL